MMNVIWLETELMGVAHVVLIFFFFFNDQQILLTKDLQTASKKLNPSLLKSEKKNKTT